MKDKGIDPYQDFAGLRFAGTHNDVVYDVRDGKADAGTIRTDTLERMSAEGKIDIKDIRLIRAYEGKTDYPDFPLPHSTRLYPEWPFAEMIHTPDELSKKVAVALMKMPRDSLAARAARCAGWTVPLNYQPVHECLKELGIGPYQDFGKVTLTQAVGQHWHRAVTVFLFLMTAATAITIRLNGRLDKSRLDLEKELSEREQTEETQS